MLPHGDLFSNNDFAYLTKVRKNLKRHNLDVASFYSKRNLLAVVIKAHNAFLTESAMFTGAFNICFA